MLFRKKIGDLSAEVAEESAARMDAGEKVQLTIPEVIEGGWFSGKAIGVNIHLRSAV